MVHFSPPDNVANKSGCLGKGYCSTGKSICAIKTSPSDDKLQELLTKHAAVFKDELGNISSHKAKLYLNSESARPKFFQPRSVPYAVNPAIDQELERLESSGVIHPVSTSEWAAPIVPVPKKRWKNPNLW